MNNLLWSILANRIYAGDTWAVAKAFVLANYIPVADQTAAGVLMENNKTSGAAVATVGAQAPGVRTASWYIQNSPFSTGYYSTAGGDIPDVSGEVGKVLETDGYRTFWASAATASLPTQATHGGQFLTTDGTNPSWAAVSALPTLDSGKFLTNNGTVASWATVSQVPAQAGGDAGKFLTTSGSAASWAAITATDLLPAQSTHSGEFLSTDGAGVLSWAAVSGAGVDTMAAVGSTPSADGGSIAGTTLTLQPADATHPGLVVVGDQSLGATTDKKTIGGWRLGTYLGGALQGIGLAGGSDSAFVFGYYSNSAYVLATTSIILQVGGNTIGTLTATALDLTGAGTSGAIKLKSPDGTVYTITVANGGTLSIV